MSRSKIVRLDARGRLKLPPEAQQALNIEPGDCLALVIENGRVYLRPMGESESEEDTRTGGKAWEKWSGGEQGLAEERATWE